MDLLAYYWETVGIFEVILKLTVSVIRYLMGRVTHSSVPPTDKEVVLSVVQHLLAVDLYDYFAYLLENYVRK